MITKASSFRAAQTIAETYEECVFRRFGGSEAICHDREPGFMPDFFRAFNPIAGLNRRATMPSQRNCETYGTNFDSRTEDVCNGCEPEGLGLIRREIGVCI